MITVPGYQVSARISESAHSVIYRARRERDQLPVILKIMRQE